MVKLEVIEGGREDVAQQALSALLTGDDAQFEKIFNTMQPAPVNLSLCGGTQLRCEQPVLDQSDADKT
ncbi:hypothetical protein GW756_06020 [bacterium]|nr:hypothetical protein [bacterium]